LLDGDGVSAAFLGLMAPVTWQPGCASLFVLLTIGVALVFLVLLVRFNINSIWLAAGGALSI
jgi:chromate transporter